MKNLFRKELKNLKAYVPGKPIEEVKKEYGLDKIVKLASNENPLGPSKKAIEAIKSEASDVNMYPVSLATELREKLAKQNDLDPDEVFVAGGGEQILKLLAQIFINDGDEALMATPSFAWYNIAVEHMGGKAIQIPLKNMKHDFEAFVDQVNDKTKLIYVCTPNNPVGNIMTKEDVNYLINNIPDDIVLVLDEAYYEYAIVNEDYPDSIEILKKRPNTLILRTFSKVAGLAGLRVGYAFTSKEIVTAMRKIKLVFNVNRIAQKAALAALDDQDHIDNTVKLNYESLGLMMNYFDEVGYEYVETNANFVFVNIKEDSRVVFEDLMKEGVIIRPGFLWGYDEWIRVSSGTIEETEFFIEKMKKVMA